MDRLRDPRARWWLTGGAVPLALVLFLFTWVALADPEDGFGETLALFMGPALLAFALARLPSWAFRIAMIPILIFELALGVFAPPLLAILLIHLVALLTQRPPPLGELRAAS
jgi:hypothetical protein